MKRLHILFLLLLYITCAKAQPVSRYDIVIDEIMADPAPAAGLPSAEFVEIKNVSGRTINLSGWRLANASSVSGAFPNYNFPADSFLIICSNASATLFLAFGKVLALSSFPALDNEGTTLSLISATGMVIHALAYHSSWHENVVKKEGGWSLEMIDTKNPCSGMQNWRSSTDISGGTPGRKNSVDAVNADNIPPRLKRTFSPDSITIVAIFDEPLDSSSAINSANYSLSNGIRVDSALPQQVLFDRVILKLTSPLQKTIVYTLSVSNVTDCKGNRIGGYKEAKAGLAEEAMQEDVLINEILFNPRPGAFDYVELHNKSNKIIDASKLFLANRSANGAIGSIRKLNETEFYIFPGEYVVATEDAGSLQHEYLVKETERILVPSSLPSYPDDKGTVVLTNSQGKIVDEVSYADEWHFALISDKEGVALERIDVSATAQDAQNWHSAASTVGFGTPTYQNSQYRQTDNVNATIEVVPKIFSPDNDGHDDIATISYRVDESGYVANVSVFDANGRLVRSFVKNCLMGLTGKWNWNGLDEKNNRLPAGIYIVYTEIFNLRGKKRSFRNTVVIGRN